jgi:pimeloyl-ACP methyl ester carboxylesterase/DNA-binding CsgD family transcriptional regulator
MAGGVPPRSCAPRLWVVETRYAKSRDAHIAYQVIGEGPIDLVYVPGWISHLELELENVLSGLFYEQLALRTRLIRFDKRGTGMSDGGDVTLTLDDRIEDIGAVMDAAGSARASLLGMSEGGTMAAAFAAVHPERVSSLILFGSHAGCVRGSNDFPCGYESSRFVDAIRAIVETRWGEGDTLDYFAPSAASGPGAGAARRWMGLFERTAAAPGTALAHLDFVEQTDARSLVRAVDVATLVLHRAGDRVVPVCNAEYLAASIPKARLVILEGNDHVPYVGDADAVVTEVFRFLADDQRLDAPERAVATILVVDLIGGADADTNAVARAAAGGMVRRLSGEPLQLANGTFAARFTTPARAIRAAAAIRDGLAASGIVARAGVHAGECELGARITGALPTLVARALAREARVGEILVSATIRDLLAGSTFTFTDRGAEIGGDDIGTWVAYPVAGPETRPSANLADVLTPAELRVARLVAAGQSNPSIATTLHVSRHTVESHLKHTYAKLGLSTRLELATLVLGR